MIPFWKKTGKHSKPQSVQRRRQNAKPVVPRTAQQSIPMQRMFEDGTCRVKPNYYTRTIQYQDINYQLAQQEDKTAIFEEWCSFLNFFDSSIKFELSFVNMATDSTEFEKSICSATSPPRKMTVTSTSTMTFARSWLPPVCRKTRSSLSTTPTPKRKRRHCSPKCALAMCEFCSEALQKWERAPTCSPDLWRCIIWMLAGSPAT